METALLIIGSILFLYAIWSLISPNTALFFIKDKSKRKRWPMGIIPLCIWFVYGMISSPFIDKDSQLSNIENDKKDTIKQASTNSTVDYSKLSEDPTTLTTEILAAYDSIHKAGLEVYEIEGIKHNSDVGPNNETWRSIQWNNAVNDATTLRIVETEINTQSQLNEITYSKWKQLESDINEAMSGTQDIHFGGYYKIGAIANLIQANRDKAIKLKEQLHALKSNMNYNK